MFKPCKPSELYFGVHKDDETGDVSVTLCPKEWWDAKGCLYDNHIKLIDNTCPWLNDVPDAECTWYVPNAPHEDIVRHILKSYGFVFNPELEPWNDPATSIPSCPRPTRPGMYLCQRTGHQWPEVAQILEDKGTLRFYCGPSVFPLDKLREDVLFWGPIRVDPKRPSES
jgi:hypothetical protein